MQTFLPHDPVSRLAVREGHKPDFAWTAQSLGDLRLNKQIVETYQILKSLSFPNERVWEPDGKLRYPAWRRHPATLQWEGYEHILYQYGFQMIQEWERRGRKADRHKENYYWIQENQQYDHSRTDLPWWFAEEWMVKVNFTHRARLFTKNPVRYAQWEAESIKFRSDKNKYTCCDRCWYWWPAHAAKTMNTKSIKAPTINPLTSPTIVL